MLVFLNGLGAFVNVNSVVVFRCLFGLLDLFRYLLLNLFGFWLCWLVVFAIALLGMVSV